MNQTDNGRKQEKEERARRIIEKAYLDARGLKFGRITIFVQDGQAFRVETTDSYTGKKSA
jgi:hypothetical protein